MLRVPNHTAEEGFPDSAGRHSLREWQNIPACSARRVTLLRWALASWMALLALSACQAQQVPLPSGPGPTAELSSEGPQKRQGDLFVADKSVDLQYAAMRLRADHLEY